MGATAGGLQDFGHFGRNYFPRCWPAVHTLDEIWVVFLNTYKMGNKEHPAECTMCGRKQKMLAVRSHNVPASDRDHGTFTTQKQLRICFCVSTSTVTSEETGLFCIISTNDRNITLLLLFYQDFFPYPLLHSPPSSSLCRGSCPFTACPHRQPIQRSA